MSSKSVFTKRGGGELQPKITIITATYNSADTLLQTIESVAGQSYPNIEYIVIDGGSTDGTVDILRQHEADIAYWVSEPDRGIYDAFNKGARHATGDYVQFLGSDDFLCQADTIQHVADQLEDSVDILSGAIWEVDTKRCRQKLHQSILPENREEFDGRMVPHPGMFVRREVLLRYPFDISYRIAADYFFFLTCWRDPDLHFKCFDEPIVYFALDGVSSSAMRQVEAENRRIWASFGIPSPEGKKNSAKNVLRAIHLYDPLRHLIHVGRHLTWQPHRCAWPSCRWCHGTDMGSWKE